MILLCLNNLAPAVVLRIVLFMNDKKTIHFISLGCPKNRVDSEVMAGVVINKGYEIVTHPQEADVIVVNTCAFINDAKQESIDTLLEMAEYRKNGQCTQLIAAGCLPQRYGVDLSSQLPEVDKFVGTGQPHLIESIINKNQKSKDMGKATSFLQTTSTPRFLESGACVAYIKIADGCSKKCAFCAIPAIRGKAKSRSIKNIVTEAERLIKKGIKELNLVAQDTAAYGEDLNNNTNLVKLVKALDKLPGKFWIRLLYLYPDAVSDELLISMANLDSLVPYLDIPIQHASSNMLLKMHRGHELNTLKNLIARAKKIVPNIILRTTVLVGHPGETQKDVDQLVEFIETAKFTHLGVFRYSPEEDTASIKMTPKVSARDSYNRWRKVMAAQRRVVKKNNKQFLGQNVEVLIESTADDSGFVLEGRHMGQAPEIDGITYVVSSAAQKGDIVLAKISDCKIFDFVAKPR